MTIIEIEVLSDIVCVWCYIGKRKLDKAISLYQKTYPGGKHDTFIIKWRPYYLNYNASATSVEKSELMKTKFNGISDEKVSAIFNRVNQVATSVGISLKFGGKIGSTRDAHRLIRLSQDKYSASVQNALVEMLFEGYHEQERDISTKTVLREIAVNAGLAEPDVDDTLDSDKYSLEVDAEAEESRKRTTGVPSFIVQKDNQIDGAQDPQEFFEAFLKVKEGE